MPKVDIWMPIYIGDYLSDTMSLSAAEHGCYLLLMMHYWKHGELISDKRKLFKIACLEPGQEYILESVLQEYFRYEDGFYIQDRIEKELMSAMSRREAARENGKKGGRPIKNNPEKTHSFSEGIPRKNLKGNPEKTHSFSEGIPRKNLKGNPEKSSSPSPSPSSLSLTEPTKEKSPKKHKHGEYKNVLLTDEEYEKLKTKVIDREASIKKMDEGIELKGYKYKSHYLAILKWAEKDNEKQAEKQSPIEIDYAAGWPGYEVEEEKEPVNVLDMEELF